MRPPRKFPKASLRYLRKSWFLRWYFNERDYQVRIGEVDKKRAEQILALSNAALTGLTDWPSEIAGQPDVLRYIANTAAKSPSLSNALTEGKTENLIRLFLKNFHASPHWHEQVEAFLLKFAKITATIAEISPITCMTFIADYRKQGKLVTSNRVKAALSGFFTWLRNMNYCPENWNPLKGVKNAKEAPPEEGILVWEPDEVMQLLLAADTLYDGIAIWIAIYGGLRRSEVARLKWEHISETVIEIKKSKTIRQRTIPLAQILIERFEKEPKVGEFIVPWEGNEAKRIEKAKDLVTTHLPQLLPDIYAEHPKIFNWNPFRHTFASRHVQAGMSLDTVADWIGDRVDTCRRHYARFVPRNRRDIRIDLADV